MTNCPHCESEDVKQRHKRLNASGEKRQRYQCNSCFKWFTVAAISEEKENAFMNTNVRRFVITACQNNASVNTEFVEALQNYCIYHNAKLLIVPIVYRPTDHEVITYNIPEDVDHELVTSKVRIHDEVFVMGKFNFIPTTVNPLSGLESLSKGDTLIVPSPQLRMKSSAVSANRHPAILHTTGAISHPEYTNTKVGEKARFNHSYSAVLVEIDKDNDFHIRVLSADDDNTFFDIGEKWSAHSKVPTIEYPLAIVTGDEHAMFSDPVVEEATYTGENSITKILKPKFVVRHDVLDMYSGSHHHKNNTIKTVAKHMFGIDKVEDELKKTVAYLKRTTGKFINIIVPSNHTDHLTKWLSTVNIKEEPWNAKFYHMMMYQVLTSLEQTETGFKHVDPFALYCEWSNLDRTEFLRPGDSFCIADVELGAHGHEGRNGSRGSISQYSDMAHKYVIGHSHTPGIVSGAYQVGTSSRLKLEYTTGPSSWAHVHCLVYANGKRQLIRIVNGRWKA